MSATRSAAAFLDRDGVINELVLDDGAGVAESPYRPEDVAIVPKVPEALRRLHEAGLAIVVASNQPAAAKGIAPVSDLDAVHRRVVELLGPAADLIAEWRYCRHHPDAAAPALRDCDCRKPKPGMLLDAASALDLDLSRSWMIGDGDRDVAAGRAAGCRTILVDYPASEHRRTGGIEPDLRAPDLGTAAAALLSAAR